MPRYERQVNGHQIDDECGGQEHDPYPEAPIPVCSPPIEAEIAAPSIFSRPDLVVRPIL
jgi:hypothetical protein